MTNSGFDYCLIRETGDGTLHKEYLPQGTKHLFLKFIGREEKRPSFSKA